MYVVYARDTQDSGIKPRLSLKQAREKPEVTLEGRGVYSSVIKSVNPTSLLERCNLRPGTPCDKAHVDMQALSSTYLQYYACNGQTTRAKTGPLPALVSGYLSGHVWTWDMYMYLPLLIPVDGLSSPNTSISTFTLMKEQYLHSTYLHPIPALFQGSR